MLCALLLLPPMSGRAEDLPDFLSAVAQGVSEGLAEGAQAAAAQELTLSLAAQDTRIEEGRTLLLTITAGNPYPAATDVTLTLDLPQRLSCAQPLTWNAQLKPAQTDPQSGELVSSVATFTREVTLSEGGESEQADISVEMNMGTRFYRAKTTLDLCVPDISAAAIVDGAQGQIVQPGASFVYQIEIRNDGTAPKDVPVALLLPAGVTPGEPLCAGFALSERSIAGSVRVEAAGESTIRLPMQVDSDALDNDEDACRLLCGVLTVDEARIALPMLKAAGPLISAGLVPEKTQLQEGEAMDMIVTVANAGLAAADVEITCLLPEGLVLMHDLTKAPETMPKETPEQHVSAMPDADSGEPPAQDGAAQAVMNSEPAEPVVYEEDGRIFLSVHMDAARETDSGIAAAALEIPLRVRAAAAVDSVDDRMLGAALAWNADGGDTHLEEAVALEIRRSGMLGLSDAEWNGILLASLLMIVTICCLYSAVKSDKREEDYCFD